MSQESVAEVIPARPVQPRGRQRGPRMAALRSRAADAQAGAVVEGVAHAEGAAKPKKHVAKAPAADNKPKSKPARTVKKS